LGVFFSFASAKGDTLVVDSSYSNAHFIGNSKLGNVWQCTRTPTTHPQHQGVALGGWPVVWVGGYFPFSWWKTGLFCGLPPYKKVIFSFEAFCILEEMALFISYFWAYKCEMRKTFCRQLSLQFALLYSLFVYFT